LGSVARVKGGNSERVEEGGVEIRWVSVPHAGEPVCTLGLMGTMREMDTMTR
jgi:hypothetical protein